MIKLIPFAIIFIGFNTNATTIKPVKSVINNVTVFTQAAQVFRSSSVTLSPGVTNLVFSGVSPFINPASLQAGGKGNFVVLGVKHQVKYPEPPKQRDGILPKEILREIANLEDSLVELGFNRDELTAQKEALQLEKDMIMKNKLARSEGKSDSLPILKQAMEFFRLKLNDINSQLTKINRAEKKVLENNKRIIARLDNLRTYKNSEEPKEKYEPVHEIIVNVSADEIVAAVIDVSYMVSHAGWIPTYDLRSSTASAPVKLTYKANVFQNSGEDWNGIKLKLSTGSPGRSTVKPVLPAWYINYYTAQREIKFQSGARAKSPENAEVTDEELKAIKKDFDELTPAQSAANYSQMIETMTNVEFDIKLSYTIPSDGLNHSVSVKTSELPAIYYHFLVPKMESEAFLIAKVTGWEELFLLPGQANIFYEGTYVGETVLNPSIINDTLELALGRDNGITVTRTRLPVKESNKLIGNDITKTVSYQLRMKSNKSKPVNLIVEDQIPLTLNKDIKIELKDNGKADYNNATGLLKWTTTLGNKEYRTLTFTYAVTYNKDTPLSMY